MDGILDESPSWPFQELERRNPWTNHLTIITKLALPDRRNPTPQEQLDELPGSGDGLLEVDPDVRQVLEAVLMERSGAGGFLRALVLVGFEAKPSCVFWGGGLKGGYLSQKQANPRRCVSNNGFGPLKMSVSIWLAFNKALGCLTLVAHGVMKNN